MQIIRQSSSSAERRPLVITGAARGIGLAAARLAAERGRALALLDRDGERLEESAASLAGLGAAEILHLAADLGREDEAERAFARIESELGPVGDLLASAGIDRGGEVDSLAVDTFDQVTGTNLRGTFICSRAAVRQMLGAGTGGAIVCVSSPFARTSAGGTAAYSASKAGVCALVRSLAVDYGSRGIRANALLPGPTETELMWANVAAGEVAGVRRTIEAEVPLARLADPVEPARAALWLLSEEASYITGAEIPCDGGVLAKASVSV